jgi:hypothetical protein
MVPSYDPIRDTLSILSLTLMVSRPGNKMSAKITEPKNPSLILPRGFSDYFSQFLGINNHDKAMKQSRELKEAKAELLALKIKYVGDDFELTKRDARIVEFKKLRCECQQ